MEGVKVIDKVKDEIIDLSADNEYTFMGSPVDRRDRFMLVFGTATGSGSDIFAYQDGTDIIVSGVGELQVFDVMGRMVMTKYVNGVETISAPTTGVYIFKLNGMTQKIVVR